MWVRFVILLQHCFDLRGHFLWVERLGDVVVGADVEID